MGSPGAFGIATVQIERTPHMDRWVEIQFDCLPLRSVSRSDVPLDASPKLRDFCARLQQAHRKHGTHNTYYLHNARCIFHLTNQPDSRDARVPLRRSRADRHRGPLHPGQRSDRRTRARNVYLARLNRWSAGFASQSSMPSASNSTVTSRPATWKRPGSGSRNCRPRVTSWKASSACISDGQTARLRNSGNYEPTSRRRTNVKLFRLQRIVKVYYFSRR